MNKKKYAFHLDGHVEVEPRSEHKHLPFGKDLSAANPAFVVEDGPATEPFFIPLFALDEEDLGGNEIEPKK